MKSLLIALEMQRFASLAVWGTMNQYNHIRNTKYLSFYYSCQQICIGHMFIFYALLWTEPVSYILLLFFFSTVLLWWFIQNIFNATNYLRNFNFFCSKFLPKLKKVFLLISEYNSMKSNSESKTRMLYNYYPFPCPTMPNFRKKNQIKTWNM